MQDFYHDSFPGRKDRPAPSVPCRNQPALQKRRETPGNPERAVAGSDNKDNGRVRLTLNPNLAFAGAYGAAYSQLITQRTQRRQERKGRKKGLLYPGLSLEFMIHPIYYNLANNNLFFPWRPLRLCVLCEMNSE